ncbi:MAG TPA: hypothetical protein ENJ21_05010 [Chromatiaceae bacterium]|nr:hypothetical protein [Chromatiaceae bacterium]
MKRQALRIELLEDCVFSASAATEGGHESLDRIPGAALLGAAAARCYGDLDRRDAWLAFHSGRLRFADALPWNGASPGWPMPMCWYHEKLAEYKQPEARKDVLRPHVIENLIHETTEEQNQPVKQLRGGYVHENGQLTSPVRELRLKTAIDPRTGRARDSQLFGYDALLRGQDFITFIEADDEMDNALFKRMVSALHGEVLLGRSRSAEYGRCRITTLEIGLPPMGESDGRRSILWLLSDLALVDANGNPVTEPTPEALGLPECRIDWSRTFLRTRRYSSWNMARRGHDSERVVLQAGGVITLIMANSFDRAALQRLHDEGVGLFRETGLGRIWVDPPLLASRKPEFGASNWSESKATAGPPEKPDEPLIHWLEETLGIDWRDKAEKKARELAESYKQTIEGARHWAGITDDLAHGPSRSQWSGIANQARENQGRVLFNALFNGDSAIVKEKGEGWNIEIPTGESPQRLASWLQNALRFDDLTSDIPKKHRDRAYAHIIRLLADHVTNTIQTRGA